MAGGKGVLVPPWERKSFGEAQRRMKRSLILHEVNQTPLPGQLRVWCLVTSNQHTFQDIGLGRVPPGCSEVAAANSRHTPTAALRWPSPQLGS